MADQTMEERERAMVEAYRSGMKVSAIEERFKVGRSTLYHVLRRSGVTPSRSRRQLDAATSEARLAGIAELVLHQDRMILELQAKNAELVKENEALKKRLASSGGSAPTRRRTKAS